jgi:cation-transporting ATPase E
MATVQAACFLVPLVRTFLAFTLPTGPLLAVAFGVAAMGCIAIEIIFRLTSRRASLSAVPPRL